ncbi:MAG: 3-deoxy-manno-octulosonate cytidylyltransferase [Phycisphaerae bacterium]|nr:3-deoxy-manno-octulosonate cytidylyltransferase [Phycisphaerae bacterium]
MNITAIIPARYASTRFPAKLLARQTGKYLIQHVYERVCQSSLVNTVIIATDDKRIGSACDEFGADWRMTRSDHNSGTDRLAEVVMGLECDIVVNVQGDEPEMRPEHIDTMIQRLQSDSQADIATLSAIITDENELTNPNVVKVVLGTNGHALYFSRWPVPYNRDNCKLSGIYRKHLGIYGYRREVLLKFSQLPPTPLEKIEKLEQLRALENGMIIAVADVDHVATGIDTPEQYNLFVKRMISRETD